MGLSGLPILWVVRGRRHSDLRRTSAVAEMRMAKGREVLHQFGLAAAKRRSIGNFDGARLSAHHRTHPPTHTYALYWIVQYIRAGAPILKQQR
jgi:hypothetical protein